MNELVSEPTKYKMYRMVQKKESRKRKKYVTKKYQECFSKNLGQPITKSILFGFTLDRFYLILW